MNAKIDINETCTNLPKYHLRQYLDSTRQASLALEALGKVIADDVSYHGSDPEPRFTMGDIEGLAIAVKMIGDMVWRETQELEESWDKSSNKSAEEV